MEKKETKGINVVKLTASEGMYIARKDRTAVCKAVFLSVNDTPEDWEEVDQQEAETIRLEIEKAAKEKANANK